MPTLDRITTGGGDKGETSLVDGSRVAKSSPRVCAYGTVDELNSIVGLVRCEELPEGLFDKICQIQSHLFDLGSELATPPAAKHLKQNWGISRKNVDLLEAWLQQVNEKLEPAPTFVLPGGTRAAALMHQARTVTRRTEREVVALAAVEAVEPLCMLYLNRLSDLFFVWARFCNNAGKDDLLWQRAE